MANPVSVVGYLYLCQGSRLESSAFVTGSEAWQRYTSRRRSLEPMMAKIGSPVSDRMVSGKTGGFGIKATQLPAY